MSPTNPKDIVYKNIAKRYNTKRRKAYSSSIEDINWEDSITALNKSGSEKRSRLSLSASSGVIGDKELRHLLRRTRFAMRRDEFTHFKDRELSSVVEELLTPSDIEIPVNNYGYEDMDPNVPIGKSFVDELYVTDNIEGARLQSLKLWALDDMLSGSERSIHASMWFFWQNHLPVQVFDVFYAYGSYRYFRILRDLALGNFKQMIIEITKDPTMLIYLNGAYNVKEAPDENYARELQELFTLGKGPESNYTEQDVSSAARVLTGWTILEYGQDAVFVPERHDTGDKHFSDFYNNRVISGRSGADGKDEYLELIDMIFDKEEVSKFICRKLYIYFCYANIDEWTEENIIEPLASTFRVSGFEVQPVLSLLFNSEHFYDSALYGAIIKSPIDFMANTIIEMGLPKKINDVEKDFLYKRSTYYRLSSVGLELAEPPSVSGWPAYYQKPIFDKYWITTTTFVRRVAMMDGLVWWGYWTPYDREIWDDMGFVKSLSNPENSDSLIAEVEHIFFGMDMSDSTRTFLKGILLSGQENDYYWTGAWLDFLSDEEDEMYRGTVLNRLRPFFQQLFQLAELHLK